MAIYRIFNGPAPTTAGQAAVTTGVVIKTMLQVKLGTATTHEAKVVDWGISYSGAAGGAPVLTELLTTDVAATVTAHVAGGIHRIDDADAAVLVDGTPIDFGTAATGYTATAEGTITATDIFDVQQVQPNAIYRYAFPESEQPDIANDEFLRIRCTVGVAVNAICWVTLRI